MLVTDPLQPVGGLITTFTMQQLIVHTVSKYLNFNFTKSNQPAEEIECINGEIQDGPNGVIEICVYGDWYPLCGDLDGWNHQDAETACRNLGQNPEGTTSSYLTF